MRAQIIIITIIQVISIERLLASSVASTSFARALQSDRKKEKKYPCSLEIDPLRQLELNSRTTKRRANPIVTSLKATRLR